MVVVGEGVGWDGHCLSKISGWVSSVISLASVSSFVMGEFRAKNSVTILLEGDGVIVCGYIWLLQLVLNEKMYLVLASHEQLRSQGTVKIK